MPDQTHREEAVEAASRVLSPAVFSALDVRAVIDAAEPHLRRGWEEELLNEENIERAAAQSYEEWAEIHLMPNEPRRWPELHEETRAELCGGRRENIREALAVLAALDTQGGRDA
jgi:hypothetical protein